MYFKEKSVEEWQSILKDLKKISIESSESKEHNVDDGKFFRESITSLEFILKGSTALSINIEKVINLFNNHNYCDIKSGLEMLRGVNCYNIDGLSKSIKTISERTGLTGIALYSDNDKEFLERSTFINKGGYKRFFFPNNRVKPDEYVNLLSNGENQINFGGINDNFIEDARRFDWDKKDYNYRVLWTQDFDFSHQFPTKPTLDKIDLDFESKKQFSKILYSLKPFKEQGKVQIILSNPNQIYECLENNYNDTTNTLNGTYFNTIKTDGIISDNEGNIFWPTNTISIKNKQLHVKDSNYVVLATNSENQIEDRFEYKTEFVSVIVDSNWFYSFVYYAIKNLCFDAQTAIEFTSCINTETREPITPNYKVEIKPTMIKTLSLIKKPDLEP